jgi:hypothetical protein
MVIPIPPRTRGISVTPTYLRRPGLLTRLRPVIAALRIYVLVANANLRMGSFRLNGVVGNVSLLLQDARDLALDLRVRGDGFILMAVTLLRNRVRKSAIGSVS